MPNTVIEEENGLQLPHGNATAHSTFCCLFGDVTPLLFSPFSPSHCQSSASVDWYGASDIKNRAIRHTKTSRRWLSLEREACRWGIRLLNTRKGNWTTDWGGFTRLWTRKRALYRDPGAPRINTATSDCHRTTSGSITKVRRPTEAVDLSRKSKLLSLVTVLFRSRARVHMCTPVKSSLSCFFCPVTLLCFLNEQEFRNGQQRTRWPRSSWPASLPRNLALITATSRFYGAC